MSIPGPLARPMMRNTKESEHGAGAQRTKLGAALRPNKEMCPARPQGAPYLLHQSVGLTLLSRQV